MNAENKSSLPTLTALRFFAATFVVVGHYGPDKLFAPGILQNALFQIHSAVTFFFVLSGFILAYNYGRGSGLSVPHKRFWLARAARILPAYYLALLIALPMFLTNVVIGYGSRGEFSTGLVLVPLLLQAWLPMAAVAWNIAAWSLSVEALFYAMFPFLWQVTAKVRSSVLLTLFMALIALVAYLRFRYASGSEFRSTTFNFFAYFPVFHIPSFAFGMTLGRIFSQARLSNGSHSALFLGGVILMLAVLFMQPLGFWTDDLLMIPLFGCIIFGASGVKRSYVILNNKYINELGEASYAMYILHLPILAWWMLFKRSTGVVLSQNLDFALYFIITVGFSVYVFHRVEGPVRRLILSGGVLGFRAEPKKQIGS